MTPSARLAAAASILDTLDLTRLVDPQLKAWARQNRFAGSGDRRAIADRIYTVLRRRRSSAAQGGAETGRALVLGSLVTEDGLGVDQISDICSGSYGLDPLSADERRALSSKPVPDSPGAELDWPDWLYPQAEHVFGASIAAELDALRQRAPLDLRVNTLRATRSEVIANLQDETGISAEPVGIAETALRLPSATRILQSRAFEEGLIEPQDAASQAVALFARAEPDKRVLDFCAGAGGKTLALAAQMQNRGELIAHDVDPRRMQDIPNRAARVGVDIIRRAAIAGLTEGRFDTVLVDAPCSGSGSWRRDPLGKWRLTDDRLAELHSAQREALSQAAAYVRQGGRLTYATCSVLPSENSGQVAYFLELNKDFELEDTLELWPDRDGCDGFYAARFYRRAAL